MKYEKCRNCIHCCRCCANDSTSIICSVCENHFDEFHPIGRFCPIDGHFLNEDDFIDNTTEAVMKENHLTIKTTLDHRAVQYFSIPLPGSVDKSDLFLKGFVYGFARARAMAKVKDPELNIITKEINNESI